MSGGLPRFLALLLIAAALAGCTSDAEDAPTDDEPSTENGPGAPGESGENATADPDPVDNSTQTDEEIIRSIGLSASANRGEAPLAVTFTGTVSADVDDGSGTTYPAEPGNFTWIITFETPDGANAEGDQTTETITADHSYETAGAFNATLTVTFEDGEQLAESLPISILEAGDGPTPPYHAEYSEAALAGFGFVLTAETAVLAYDACGTGALHGTWILCYEIPVEDGAKEMKIVVAGPAGIVPDYELGVFDPSGGLAASSTTGGADEEATITNPTAGTWLAAVILHVGTAADGDIPTTIDVTY